MQGHPNKGYQHTKVLRETKGGTGGHSKCATDRGNYDHPPQRFKYCIGACALTYNDDRCRYGLQPTMAAANKWGDSKAHHMEG